MIELREFYNKISLEIARGGGLEPPQKSHVLPHTTHYVTLYIRVAQNTGVGPCSRFKTFCFVLGVLKRGVLLLGGGGTYRATGVPSEYMVYATSI